MFEKGLLAGKRILVTGGGSGLGAAMGRRFAALGAELIICGRRLELLEAAAARMRAAPAVSCAKLCEEPHTSIQVQRRQSGIPCAMVLRLISRSPR